MVGKAVLVTSSRQLLFADISKNVIAIDACGTRGRDVGGGEGKTTLWYSITSCQTHDYCPRTTIKEMLGLTNFELSCTTFENFHVERHTADTEDP